MCQLRCADTNGILLVEKADEIIDNLDTITISAFESDIEGWQQYKIIKEFLKIKGNRKPNVIIRCLGSVNINKYKGLGCIIAKRTLHSPMGSFKYKKSPTIPEIGICLDILNHLVIKRDGKVSMCVRLDPTGLGVIGDCNNQKLIDIWNGDERRERIKKHILGKREDVPLCDKCEYWGCPTGY